MGKREYSEKANNSVYNSGERFANSKRQKEQFAKGHGPGQKAAGRPAEGTQRGKQANKQTAGAGQQQGGRAGKRAQSPDGWYFGRGQSTNCQGRGEADGRADRRPSGKAAEHQQQGPRAAGQATSKPQPHDRQLMASRPHF